MAKAKKSVKAKRTPKAKKPTQAQIERGQRDERFATIINGMRTEIANNQQQRPSESNDATTALDELQKLYDEK